LIYHTPSQRCPPSVPSFFSPLFSSQPLSASSATCSVSRHWTRSISNLELSKNAMPASTRALRRSISTPRRSPRPAEPRTAQTLHSYRINQASAQARLSVSATPQTAAATVINAIRRRSHRSSSDFLSPSELHSSAIEKKSIFE
ncbi:hypothetical protein PMAYCL1PPCAC_15287, partial [Pristionchus mayeri]